MIPRPRASDAYRVWNCPRSHTAEQTLIEFGLLPTIQSNPHAETGTIQHKALAGEEVALSEPETRSVNESAALVEAFLEREHLDEAYFDKRELGLETQFWTGHIDRAVVDADSKTGAIFDYKQVRWGDHAHAADNPQLWIYCYLLAENYPIDQCWAVLQQPGHEQTSELFDPKALKSLKDWAIATSQKALDPTAQLKAGEWCQHCRLRAICPEGVKYLWATQELAEDEELPVSDPAILGMILDRFRVLGWFEDAIKNLSKILLRRDSDAVTGWKLTKGRQVTVIKDLVGAYQTTKNLGIAESAWHEPSAKKLRAELERAVEQDQINQTDVAKIIDIVTEPGALIRMTKQERRALGL